MPCPRLSGYQGNAPDEEGGDWLVLGPDGEALWQVTPPDGVRFQTASGSSVWGTWLDDFDVPYVGRFEVLGPEGAAGTTTH